jgi:molecular chaperone IbpA
MHELTFNSPRLVPTINNYGGYLIGIDHLMDTLNTMEAWINTDSSSRKGYPPYNVISRDEDHYAIELAVAGFGESELEVKVNNGTLVITGEASQQTDESVNYLHRGLSRRKFQREFRLVEYVNVTSVTVANGIMTIELERQLPEALRPRTIDIKFVR